MNGRLLKVGDHGSYGELAACLLPDGLTVIFMPSLAALLDHAEGLNGAPLTEEQVLQIRDRAAAVVTPVDVAAAVVKERGYAEVDPNDAWASWQSLR